MILFNVQKNRAWTGTEARAKAGAKVWAWAETRAWAGTWVRTGIWASAWARIT
jgi:hypothetical protein